MLMMLSGDLNNMPGELASDSDFDRSYPILTIV